MNIQEERRKFRRFNVLADVVYNKRLSLEKGRLSLTKNISKGGICLIVYEELKELDLLDLKIYLPESKTPISAVGRVVWVRDFIIGDIAYGKRFDIGIEFIEINEKDLNQLDKYLF
jgi:hypothetical protein